MMGWIFDVPLWVSGPVIVGLLVGFALWGLGYVRARILPRIAVSHSDSHFVGPMVHSIMVFYGLILALIAVNVFETYSECTRIVSNEASAINMLYRDVSSYPEPARSQLQGALRSYTSQVIHEAWPLQRRGHTPTAGFALMDSVQVRLAPFEPATEGQKALHAEAWRAFNHVIEARRTRVSEVTTGLPGVMWMIVVLGAVIALSASFFFHVEDVKLHAILVTLLAVFIASVIFVVLAMDHPFRGDLGLSAEPYQLIYDHLMTQ